MLILAGKADQRRVSDFDAMAAEYAYMSLLMHKQASTTRETSTRDHSRLKTAVH